MGATYNAANPFRTHAKRDPAAPALRCPDKDGGWTTTSYGQLDRLSDSYARGFVKVGIHKGDRAWVLLRPSADLYATLLALFKIGAVPVLVDPGMGPRAVLACVERTRPRVVIAERAVHALAMVSRAPFRHTAVRISRGAFPGTQTLSRCALPDDVPFTPVLCEALDDAAILFTSGSTGPAKGVGNRQEMFAAQVTALADHFGFRPGMTDVQCFAAFALFDLSLGLCSVLPHMDLSRPASANPAEIVRAIQTFSAEISFASPIVWFHVGPWCVAKGTRLLSLEVVITVGAPIPAKLHASFRKVLRSDCEIHTPYGATEAMPLCSIASNEILETRAQSEGGAGTCVGRPLPGVDLRLIRITDNAIAVWSDTDRVGATEIGEVVAGGSVVSLGYKDAADANAYAKIRDGDQILHRMGDLGRFDEQGRLWFCGRKAHAIHTSSGFVPAVPVENIANQQPDIFRSALVGVGPVGRQVAVLCVEMRDGRVFDDVVLRDVRRNLDNSSYVGLVQRVLVHPKFPTDARHNSKIRNEELALWASERCRDLAEHR